MKKYSVSVVRERLSEALDEAERGVPVIIERKGVRYRLTVERERPERAVRRKPLFKVLDPAILEGQWTWSGAPAQLKFRKRR